MNEKVVPSFLANVRSYVSSYDMINALMLGLKRDFEQGIISKKEFKEVNESFIKEKKLIKKQSKRKGLVALL